MSKLRLSHQVIVTGTAGDDTVGPPGEMSTTGGVLSPPPMSGMLLGVVGLVGCCAAIDRNGTVRNAMHAASAAATNDDVDQCT